jgi:hypothetical protein
VIDVVVSAAKQFFFFSRRRLLIIRAIAEMRTDFDTTVDLSREYPCSQRLLLLGLYKGTQNSCNMDKIVVCFGITRIDCEARRFIWEMTGESIFQAVLLEVSNEFSNH